MDGLAHWFINTPAFKGALAGLVSAALVDLHAMSKFTGWNDFKSYNFGTATFRWAMGAVSGGLTQAGFGALFS